MSQPAPKLYTLEEYFALEEVAEERHEYYQGHIYAMSGGTANHDLIAGNVYLAPPSWAGNVVTKKIQKSE